MPASSPAFAVETAVLVGCFTVGRFLTKKPAGAERKGRCYAGETQDKSGFAERRGGWKGREGGQRERSENKQYEEQAVSEPLGQSSELLGPQFTHLYKGPRVTQQSGVV